MNEIVNCAAYLEGRRIANVEINNIHEVLEHPEQFLWVGLHEPGEETLVKFQKEFDLHDLAIEDAHVAHQRPKLERYGDTVFIVLRTAQKNTTLKRIDFGETHFFVGSHFLVTIRHGSSISYADVESAAKAHRIFCAKARDLHCTQSWIR